MPTSEIADLESLYKQFKLGNLPIFQNMHLISIGKLFRILTNTELKDLPTIEAMNFYLYCHFFKNRLLYSPIFSKNLSYMNLESDELKQRIKFALDKYDQMLQVTKSESDGAWIDDNIAILKDGLVMLDSVPTRCDYYDSKVAQYLSGNPKAENTEDLLDIENECAAEFARLSQLFSEVGRLIGRE